MIRDKNNGQFKRIEVSKGSTYNNWIFIEFSHIGKNGASFWVCKCVCGLSKSVAAHRVINGGSKSCGCLRLKADYNIKHGLKKHPIYNVWNAMKQRCYNHKCESYPHYGGRGIVVCDRWRNSFENFYKDMNKGYIKGQVAIDRFPNVNGNYEPSNCRWATIEQSANNKTTSKYLSKNGIVRTASEWGKLLGIHPDTIRHRKRKGYSDSECLSIYSLIKKKVNYV